MKELDQIHAFITHPHNSAEAVSVSSKTGFELLSPYLHAHSLAHNYSDDGY